MRREVADENGRTELHRAAIEGDAVVVQSLLDDGADIDARDRWGRTPLFVAIYEEPLVQDRQPVVRLLLSRGADVNTRDEADDTPLHMAALGESKIADLLLEYGADVCAVNAIGKLPLDMAERYREHEIAQKLRSAAACAVW